MMECKESEALEKTCHLTIQRNFQAHCLGAQCMAWTWKATMEQVVTEYAFFGGEKRPLAPTGDG